MIEDPKSNLEARRIANSEAISTLWQPDAQKVLDLVDAGNNLICVAAPYGSGKSCNLRSNFIRFAPERGYQSITTDCSLFVDRRQEEVIEVLESVIRRSNYDLRKGKGIMVFDEMELLDILHENTPAMLKLLKKKGFVAVVGLIPVNNPEDKARWVTPLLNKEQALGGKATVYEMQPRKLPKELAREFLAVNNVKPELIEFILSNLPAYIRVLAHLSGGKSKHEIAKHVFFALQKNFFGFSEEEIEEINRKLGFE